MPAEAGRRVSGPRTVESRGSLRSPASLLLLRERGITQTALSRVVGCSTSHVHGVLNRLLGPRYGIRHSRPRPREALFTPEILEASRDS